jgi:hypothetical protein
VKRPVVVAVVSALLVGVGVGFLIATASQTPTAAAGSAPDLQVVSRWSGRMFDSRVMLLAGSLQADPRRGFALVQTHGMKPVFFSTPEGAGALRLQSSSASGWVLRSRAGALVLATPGFRGPKVPPLFTFLGRRLNPEKLGPITSRGVAVAFGAGRWNYTTGRQTKSYVIFVAHTKAWPGWKLYGYLQSFTLPRAVAEHKPRHPLLPLLGTGQELKQPLLGPGGRYYSIDSRNQRLVPASGWHSVARTFNFGDCTTWPARNGGSYRACPNSIVLHKANGSTQSVLQRHLGKISAESWSWVFAQPSPNGKWLLLQDAFGACGLPTWAYFVPSRGGPLWSAFPGDYTSEALGWLPDNTALVAAQSEGCEGNQNDGIYQVTPSNPTFPEAQLVFAGDVFDATTWGFRGKLAG